MHRTILVAAHADEAGHDALALGIELARPAGADVVLAGVATGRHRGDAELDAILAGLQPLRDGAPLDVPVSVEAIGAESVVAGLEELAALHEASVMVLGPTHRGMLGRAFAGDLAAGALSGRCIVAVAERGQAMREPRTVGVAWDGSAESGEALEWAVQFTERIGGVLHVVRVLDPAHAEGTVPADGHAAEVDAVVASARERVEAHARVVWGDADELLVTVSHDVDLLVLGSRAQGTVGRALRGSVSARLMHDAHSAVVVVPRGARVAMDTRA